MACKVEVCPGSPECRKYNQPASNHSLLYIHSPIRMMNPACLVHVHPILFLPIMLPRRHGTTSFRPSTLTVDDVDHRIIT